MRKGEVWLVSLDPTIGTEINKTRPAVIVNDDAIGILPLKVIVPITDWKDRYAIRPWMVYLEARLDNGLTKLSAVDTFQVRSVSETRLIKRLGILSEAEIVLVSKALAIVLGFQSEG
ncbi:MAG: type II toxin-antitoxin system PemK/MazF family toxin [Microcystaceae cyanobacterium]